MLRVIVSSGGPFHAYHLARGAQAAGYLKRFITTVFDGTEAGLDLRLTRQIKLPAALAIGMRAIPIPGADYWSFLIGDNLYDLLARRWVDECECFHVFNNYGLYSLRKAKRLKATVIVERSSGHPAYVDRLLEDEYARWGWRLPSSHRWLLRKQVQEFVEADYVMVPSDYVWRTMVREGVPESKLVRVHLGFDPGRFTPPDAPRDDGVFRVIYVGALSLQKGLPYLLEAWRRLNLPRSELLFVGNVSADANAFLPKYAGLFRHVRFVPHEKLPAYYHNASVFVLPSLQDGFGMVVYEAAACGLPVIITENVGATVRDGVDGFVVPIRDAEALAAKLLYLYEHPAERRAMGQSAREYLSRYTWSAYHAELAEHYRNLNGTKPRSPLL
ncbi:MAG: glycosyltransferase family 4 protein [Chloroflexi bacterium]|nr:glycosyltransferase family 4 protein [Chloroflexota bacterium]